MRAALCLALKMGLFLHAIGAVTPTEPTADGSLLHCEGVRNQSYVCESGHCCGESQCCSYYYELWWFWLVWALIFILSCCCVCHHRRTKHRLQQQQRQHEINLIAYREAHNYTAVPFYFRFLPNYLLPDYDEVVNRPPTPPPPYSALRTSPSLAPSPLTPDQQDVCCPPSQSAAVPPASDPRWPSLDEPHPPITIGSYRHKPDDKPLAQAPQEGDSLSGGPPERLPSDGSAGPEKGEDCCKEPLLGGTGTEDKERVSGGGGGRRRRFTGDSGIEVCVCGRDGGGGFGGGGGGGGSQEDREVRELESLLSREEEEEEGEEEEEEETRDFCDGCGHPAPTGDEEARPGAGPEAGPERGPSIAPPPPVAPPPVCLLLHTINEQEGHHHGNSTEPQG